MNGWILGGWIILIGQAIRLAWLTIQDCRNTPAGQWVTTEHLWPFLALAIAQAMIAYGARS